MRNNQKHPKPTIHPLKHRGLLGRILNKILLIWQMLRYKTKGSKAPLWLLLTLLLVVASMFVQQDSTSAMPQEMNKPVMVYEKPIPKGQELLWWEDIRHNQELSNGTIAAKPTKKVKAKKEKPIKIAKAEYAPAAVEMPQEGTVRNGFSVQGKDWLEKAEFRGDHLKSAAAKAEWNKKKAAWQKSVLSIKSSFLAAAKSMQEKHGIPAAITLAQMIYEGGWGTSEFASQNNHFGMKGNGKGEGHVNSTNGYQAFASLWYGFHYYAQNVKMTFAKNRKGNTTKDWTDCLCSHAKGIGKYDYAGDCVLKGKQSYDQKILGIIKQYNLEQYND